jgi:hypothetical protein
MREHVQRHDDSEEHGHPGALQPRSRQDIKDHMSISLHIIWSLMSGACPFKPLLM